MKRLRFPHFQQFRLIELSPFDDHFTHALIHKSVIPAWIAG
jgi:hypothetical protein